MDMVRKYVRLLLTLIGLIFADNVSGQTINSHFRPFTYDEMAAPLQAYSNFVNQCLGTLQDLMDNAETIEQYIDKDKDPISWRRYADYYNSCVDEYNRITKNGTNQQTRTRINNLKKQFPRVINGIGRAYNRRSDLANDQYNRLRSTNQRCDRFYSDISLDEFLDGNTPSVNYY